MLPVEEERGGLGDSSPDNRRPPRRFVSQYLCVWSLGASAVIRTVVGTLGAHTQSERTTDDAEARQVTHVLGNMLSMNLLR